MARNPNLKENCPRLTGKILWTPFALAGWMVVANCSTLPPTQVADNDLSSSYAVKSLSVKHTEIKKFSRDPRSYYHYLLALKAESKSRFEDAASHYMEVVRHDPEMEDMREILSQLLLRSGQIDKLIEVSQESLERFPENPVINMILADVLAGGRQQCPGSRDGDRSARCGNGKHACSSAKSPRRRESWRAVMKIRRGLGSQVRELKCRTRCVRLGRACAARSR